MFVLSTLCVTCFVTASVAVYERTNERRIYCRQQGP